MGDHERVAFLAGELARRGVLVMVTEGDSEQARKLYREFNVRTVGVRRSVSCNAQRFPATELVITSY